VPPAIQFDSVSKAYAIYDSPGDRLKELLTANRRTWHKDFWALNDVSFEVKRGETFCIIGENGSGKSTLLRVLAGAERMDEGEIDRPAAFGWCPQDCLLYPHLTPDEHVALFGRGYGLARDAARARAEALYERFGLAPHRRRLVRVLSGGTRQKLNLALAVLHRPPLLLLDEPYAGLDARSYERFLVFLDDERRGGTCVVMVTHLLHEDGRFDRVLHLRDGRLHVAR
jgi:ABC-2 type transport system ATP-binding protein